MRLGTNILDEKFYIEVWLGKSYRKNFAYRGVGPPFPSPVPALPPPPYGWVVLLGNGLAMDRQWQCVTD
jgi:hypothetical protein